MGQGVSGGACGGARAFCHLNINDNVDALFIYMVWPPWETHFVRACVCSFFHLNSKYNVDYLFTYMVWEPRANTPFNRAHLLNVGHGMIHANGMYHSITLTHGRRLRRVGLPHGHGTAMERSCNDHAELFTEQAITIACT